MSRSWYVAPSLNQLLYEVNQEWPNRDRKSDGAIGDDAHSYRESDHNPNVRGSVNARDFDRDGIDPMWLKNKLVADSRTNYVIYNRTIWAMSRNFQPRPYYGANPHTGHLHISILQNPAAENDTRSWGIANTIEKDLDMANEKELAEAFWNFPMTANGKTQSTAQHFAELLVDTRAQSNAVTTEYKRDVKFQEQILAELKRLNSVIGGLM